MVGRDLLKIEGFDFDTWSNLLLRGKGEMGSVVVDGKVKDRDIYTDKIHGI